ncbi:STT3 domain-containing protein [Thermococcus atlanticus]
MVKTKVKAKEKKKKKEKDDEIHIPFSYQKFKMYGFPLIVLLVAFIGYRIRMETAQLKYFVDPDTFFHYEMYRLAVHEWIPKYFAYAEPPAGIKVTGSLGLYMIPAALYKFFAIFGITELGFYRMWPALVGFLTIIAAYFLGRKLHSEWAGLWAALIMMFSYANFTKTMSGNGRGEGPFMMFFFYAVLFMTMYLDEKGFNWKKALWGILFVLTSVAFTSVWNGSQFGIGILLVFMAVNAILLFTWGKIAELKTFIREFYPAFLLILVISLGLSYRGIVGIRSFLVFALQGFVAVVALSAVMLYGERLKLNYSDKKHRFAAVVAVGILGFAAAYLYFGPDLWKFMGGAYQSNPLYQTVAELAKTSFRDIKMYYSVKTSDALVFFLSLGGFFLVLLRFVRKLMKGDITGYKEVFLVAYYVSSLYLLAMAVRFIFQASGSIILFAGIFIGELFLFVENMKDTPTTKAMYSIFLIILFLPLPIVGAQHMNQIASYYSRGEAVPPSWQNTLLWLKNNSNPLDSATSWWDYGYWIESSLLSHRRASTDGGHAYDRRYIVADFLSHYGNRSEVDFEAWELNYLILWQQDIYKFNAISYLGGAINYGEYRNTPMFQPIPLTAIRFDNQTRKYYIQTRGGAVMPMMTVDLRSGRIVQGGAGSAPYVLYIFQNYGLLAYKNIAFSNFVRLAFHLPFSFEKWDAQKLFANFQLVHSAGDVATYRFRPFAVYMIQSLENGTWKIAYTALGGGKLPPGRHQFKLYISAFGRDIKDATLLFEAYNGTKLVEKKTIARNLNMDHLHETPLQFNLTVPNATKYRFVLIQDGPVGVIDGKVRVNGRVVDPTYVLGEGKSGTLELTAAFRRDYTANLTLRASIVYYVTPNGKDIYQDRFQLEPHMDIIDYIPVKQGLSVKAGDNRIKAQAKMPENVFDSYIQKLYSKYGKDGVVIVRKRIEPIFIAKKGYVIWEG